MTARHAPATARNRDPILAVLRDVLPEQGLVLEVARGTGEHAAAFAAALPALALAAIAAGADGLIVEVHPEPERALSDGRQSLDFDAWGRMVGAIGQVAEAVGRLAPTGVAAPSSR